jgi:cytochrome c
MKTQMILAAAAAMMTAAPAVAQDAAAGERVWAQCRACHMIQDDDGTDIQRGGRTGPNLYNIIGSTAGTEEGFRYSAGMVAAGEAGLVWDEENIVAYLADPTAFLREYLDDNSVRGNMAFQLRREEQARDMAAYLATVSPDAPAAEEGEEES